jgi:multidrug efflux system outer membrane protein
MMKMHLAAMAAALALAGCSLEPTYERPAAPVAGAYPQGPAYVHASANTDIAAADIGWRDFLEDPRLQQLVAIALANNRDLRVAALNVEAARAQLRVQRSELYPSVGASASHVASRVSPGETASGSAVQSRYYTAGLDLSWELDFFGRVRSLSDAAFEQYVASDQGRRAEQILLVSQVADQYLALLSDDELLAITRETLTTAQDSYKLTKAQLDAGTGTELSLRQAETVVEQAQASYAALTRTRAQDENALVLLLGQPMPTDLPPPLALDAQVLTDVPAGLPSDLLTRRPDIMQAEASLRAANANIGAARAAFFPSIDLTGSYGAASTALSGLFHGGALAWSFVPSLTVPIFEGGRLRASLDLAQVQKDIGVAQYEKSIQSAFTEVANGLAARGTYDDQVDALTRLVAADQSTLDLSSLRFKTGVDSYVNVLTAQTQLYSAQQQLVGARLARLTNRVDLYRALGGGWTSSTIVAQVARSPLVEPPLPTTTSFGIDSQEH